MPRPLPFFDVLIVGSGLAGATLARVVRDALPEAEIGMIEAGGAIGTPPGRHLLGVMEDDIRRLYRSRAVPALQSAYVAGSDAAATLEAGIWSAAGMGMRAERFPGAAVAHNLGGMGVHWTAACPTAYGEEVPEAISPAEWARATAEAQRLFSVTGEAFPSTPVSAAVLERLAELFPSPLPDRAVQPMPMAGAPDADGVFRRASPGTIFAPILEGNDPRFTLLTATLATGIAHGGGRAKGVRVRDLRSGEAGEIYAQTVIVAADTIRTPQLLWASGIRHRALGRYLNEHTNLSAYTFLDLDKLGVAASDLVPVHEEEPFYAAFWLPSRGADQPVHGQMMGRVTEDGRYRQGLTWYLRSGLNPDNRLEFADDAVDAFGQPATTVHFAYSENDIRATEAARESQALAGHALGDFDPAEAIFLPPGSSLHYTGTVRMGTDEDTSVCDPAGRVWGFDNLFVAGNGVVPTALSCNCTLTAATLAVLTAEEACRTLAGASR